MKRSTVTHTREWFRVINGTIYHFRILEWGEGKVDTSIYKETSSSQTLVHYWTSVNGKITGMLN